MPLEANIPDIRRTAQERELAQRDLFAGVLNSVIWHADTAGRLDIEKALPEAMRLSDLLRDQLRIVHGLALLQQRQNDRMRAALRRVLYGDEADEEADEMGELHKAALSRGRP